MKRELEKIMIEDVEFAYDSEKEYIKDGHAYCKVCHERKDGDVMEFFGNKMILRVACKCDREIEKQKKRSRNVRNAVRILNTKLIGNKSIFIIHLINTLHFF